MLWNIGCLNVISLCSNICQWVTSKPNQLLWRTKCSRRTQRLVRMDPPFVWPTLEPHFPIQPTFWAASWAEWRPWALDWLPLRARRAWWGWRRLSARWGDIRRRVGGESYRRSRWTRRRARLRPSCALDPPPRPSWHQGSKTTSWVRMEETKVGEISRAQLTWKKLIGVENSVISKDQPIFYCFSCSQSYIYIYSMSRMHTEIKMSIVCLGKFEQ